MNKSSPKVPQGLRFRMIPQNIPLKASRRMGKFISTTMGRRSRSTAVDDHTVSMNEALRSSATLHVPTSTLQKTGKEFRTKEERKSSRYRRWRREQKGRGERWNERLRKPKTRPSRRKKRKTGSKDKGHGVGVSVSQDYVKYGTVFYYKLPHASVGSSGIASVVETDSSDTDIPGNDDFLDGSRTRSTTLNLGKWSRQHLDHINLETCQSPRITWWAAIYSHVCRASSTRRLIARSWMVKPTASISIRCSTLLWQDQLAGRKCWRMMMLENPCEKNGWVNMMQESMISV